jgi:hypothetical protein
MTTGRLAFKILIVVAVVAILGTVISALAQLNPAPVGQGSAAARVNALVMLEQIGASKYVAAGTGNGIRVYELRRVGNEWQVTDVTRVAEPGR